MIGLFTGMSILSWFEIIFWIWRALVHGLNLGVKACKRKAGGKSDPEGDTEPAHNEIIVVEPKEKRKSEMKDEKVQHMANSTG